MATSSSLTGKVALVTGSTSGIGKGIAHCLASKGCSVVLTGLATDIEIEALMKEFRSQYKTTFHFVPGDFLVTESTEKFSLDVLAIYPDGIDILVNSAGVPGRGPIDSLPTKAWLDTMAINLTAPFILTRAFFPLMKKKGWGRIIYMSSGMALIADPGKIAYCSTKAGLLGMSRVVAVEGAEHGVTCNAVCPGYVDAPMCHSIIANKASKEGVPFEQAMSEFAQVRPPSGRLITVTEVAELVAFLCSDLAASISGSPIPIDSGLVIFNRAGNVL